MSNIIGAFINGVEIACLVGLVVCIGAYIYLTIEDRIDYHYSRKRGEI